MVDFYSAVPLKKTGACTFTLDADGDGVIDGWVFPDEAFNPEIGDYYWAFNSITVSLCNTTFFVGHTEKIRWYKDAWQSDGGYEPFVKSQVLHLDAAPENCLMPFCAVSTNYGPADNCAAEYGAGCVDGHGTFDWAGRYNGQTTYANIYE